MEKHKQRVINLHHKIIKRIKGFTLIEIILVIAIIGILATIGIISYGDFNKKISIAQIKSELSSAGTAMESYKNFKNLYPDTLPSDFEYNSDLSFTGPGGSATISLAGGTEFCIEGTNTLRPDVGIFSISSYGSSTEVYEGSCWQILASNGVYFWKSISSSRNYSNCAIATDDKAYCWGNNTNGQLGNNSTIPSSIPVAVDTSVALNGKTIKAISAGVSTTCAIASDDKAYCWGLNTNGQLGNNSVVQSLVPVAVDTSGALSGKTVKDISAGGSTTCAIASDNAYCWGLNTNGRLGNNSITQSLFPVAVDTSVALNGKTVKAISAGGATNCAIASDDKVYCWGYNTEGQVGNNSTVAKLVPTAVDTSGALSGKTIKSISAGSSAICAIASDSNVYCWGYNISGQLGNNSVVQSLVPVAVDTSVALNGKTVKAISAGGSNTCAIASDNNVYCWGSNSFYSLATKSIFNRHSTPQKILATESYFDSHGYLSAMKVVSGSGLNCAIASDNNAYCWGSDLYGRLGVGSLYMVSSAPLLVSKTGLLNGKTIKAISAGDSSVCVIASDDKAYCWGHNNYGQLGNNTKIDSEIPVAVDTTTLLSGKTIKAISIREGHACAIASDNNVYCWGRNNYGQLGNNSSVESSVPVAVDKTGVFNGKTVKSISVGSLTTCAIASDDKVYCWGYGSRGELGNPSVIGGWTYIPVAVDATTLLSGKTIKAISSGSDYTCAIASDNNEYCWGYNNYGQLGNNSTANGTVPVAVNTAVALAGKTIKAISAGNIHNCAIASDNKAYCWGSNGSGQFGDGTITSSLVPVAVNTTGVLSGKTISGISAGAAITCANTSENKVYCWGTNGSGQNGVGTYGFEELNNESRLPRQVWGALQPPYPN